MWTMLLLLLLLLLLLPVVVAFVAGIELSGSISQVRGTS
jgi:hypothetical protein